MKRILVIGAGRSATSLIDYLLEHSEAEDWQITIGDQDEELAKKRVSGHSRASAIAFDATDKEFRRNQIEAHDLVISMLPASMHTPVAKDCIELKKHIITPSYVTDEMRELDEAARENGVLILNEMGVDPGIDHMSAMKVLDSIRNQGGEMVVFESFTGGLLAPESEDNPWKYKFTWNPRNVVLAGAGGAVKFRQNGMYKYIPYHRLFRRTEQIDIKGYGRFEGYANRDSLKYREIYGLKDIPTIYRGTLRRPGFCRAWNVFVQLGMTDDSYVMEGSAGMTHREFVNAFLAYNPHDSVELKLMHYLKIDQDDDLMEKLECTGIFDREPIGLKDNATPAQALQKILEKCWKLNPNDRDMIVMWHKFGYRLNGHPHQINASMAVIGDDRERTAMAKTVGLPVGIAARQILNGEIRETGVHLPVVPGIYEPILNELADKGILFEEEEVEPRLY